MSKIAPNVLVTGTPGVGKSTFSRKLAQKTDLQWLDVSNYAESSGFVTGDPDPVYHSRILDEDRLLDALEEKIHDGGYIIDHHSSDLFPVRWFDFVVVLIVGNTILYDRLSARGYTGKKLDDNVECEIFQTILEDVRESFSNNIIRVFTNATPEDMRLNLTTLTAAITEWVATPSNSTSDASIEMPFVEITEAEIPEPEERQAEVPEEENAEEENAEEENAEEEMEDSEASDYEETDSSETESPEVELVVEVLPRSLEAEVSLSESSEELSDSDALEPEVSDDEDVQEVLETED